MEKDLAKVERFEDLICWQKARVLVREIYSLTRHDHFSRDFRLRDQLRSAAVSVMSNIAEGFARFHKRDFIRFLDIAQSSAAEVSSLLYVVVDQNLVQQSDIQKIRQLTDDTRKVTLGLLRYVKKSIENDATVIKEPDQTYGFAQKNESIEIPDNFINTNN